MFTTSEFERINDEFKKELKTLSTKNKRIWGILFFATTVLIVLLIIIFPNQFKNEEVSWILPVYGGMAFLLTLIGFLISLNYISEKPFFTVLFEKIYRKINLDEGIFLEYKSYDKDNIGYNKTGGLFTKWSRVINRRHISGNTENQHKFDVFDCVMVTSSGKNKRVHFDGTYLILHKKPNTIVQFRSGGSPKLKNIKFSKIENEYGFKIYKELDKELSSTDLTLQRYYEKLISLKGIKRVYLGTTENEIHIALAYRKYPARKKKNVTIQTCNDYLSYFKSELAMIDEIDNLY